MQVVRPGLAGRGVRLSNTWSTYPADGYNPGKLGLIADRGWVLEGPVLERPNRPCRGWAPQDGTAPYQVDGGVTAHRAYNGCGPWEGEPGDGH